MRKNAGRGGGGGLIGVGKGKINWEMGRRNKMGGGDKRGRGEYRGGNRRVFAISIWRDDVQLFFFASLIKYSCIQSPQIKLKLKKIFHHFIRY